MSYSKLSRILEIDISKDPKMMLDEIAKLGRIFFYTKGNFKVNHFI